MRRRRVWSGCIQITILSAAGSWTYQLLDKSVLEPVYWRSQGTTVWTVQSWYLVQCHREAPSNLGLWFNQFVSLWEHCDLSCWYEGSTHNKRFHAEVILFDRLTLSNRVSKTFSVGIFSTSQCQSDPSGCQLDCAISLHKNPSVAILQCGWIRWSHEPSWWLMGSTVSWEPGVQSLILDTFSLASICYTHHSHG